MHCKQLIAWQTRLSRLDAWLLTISSMDRAKCWRCATITGLLKDNGPDDSATVERPEGTAATSW